jgi:hypothetical protein
MSMWIVDGLKVCAGRSNRASLELTPRVYLRVRNVEPAMARFFKETFISRPRGLLTPSLAALKTIDRSAQLHSCLDGYAAEFDVLRSETSYRNTSHYIKAVQAPEDAYGAAMACQFLEHFMMEDVRTDKTRVQIAIIPRRQ